ncbi:MAG: hypothetical protein KKD44_22320 [Proteobacteria bacterium]|nr:hypothetical protein [Pseudomonadota bacterium]
MKIIVFCGPTITDYEASGILKAEYRPPVTHGDLISCVYADKPDVIVIIDGAFIDHLTVWHNEINEAMNKGIMVFGASAMGAIRAAELKMWGMQGIGEVFNLIENGTIEADDEVLCDFTLIDGMYHKKTISVVNLRFILNKATDKALISQGQSDDILNVVQAMYYKERSPDKIISLCIDKGILTSKESSSLFKYISLSRSDIQKQDAILCLETVGKLRVEDLDKTQKHFEYDLFFEALYERDRGTKHGNGYHPFYKIANDYVMYSEDIESVNDAALNRKICALVADNFNIQASDKDISEERDLFAKKHHLSCEDDYLKWLNDNDLSEQDFQDLLAERIKINKLQKWYLPRLGFAKNTRYLLEELKLNNQYTTWKQKSIDIHDTLKNNHDDTSNTFITSDIMKLAHRFLKHNSRQWEQAPFHFMNKIGMNQQVFKHLLARDKTLSDVVTMEIYNQA